jgi:hypothetical protein
MKSLYLIYKSADKAATAAFNHYLKNIRCPDAAAIFEAAKETRTLAFNAWITS